MVESRVEDALTLWDAGRREGAFLLAIVAVVVRAREEYPRPMGEGESFRRYVESRFPTRISLEYQGRQWPIEQIFYKWFRCEIVHAGGLPVDIGFIEDTEPGALIARAGGAPEYRLLFSAGWFQQLIAWAQD